MSNEHCTSSRNEVQMDSREAFEKKCMEEGFNISKPMFPAESVDTYLNRDTELYFMGWQAAIAHAASQRLSEQAPCDTPEVEAEPVGIVRHYQYAGIAKNGFRQEAVLNDDAPLLPDNAPLYTKPQPQEVVAEQLPGCSIPDVEHICNEWADAACNGLVWLRNLRDGISKADDAIAEMESNIARIRALSAAPTQTDSGDKG